MDRRIKFRHLEAFSAIARAGSLKQAAEQLHLTQPAISRTLKELEEIAGARLMHRDRAGIRLTPAGEVFLQFAEQSTTALRHGLRSIRGGEQTSRLRIGALPSASFTLLPEAVSRFMAEAPDTLVEVQEGQHDDLMTQLRGGDLDIVVGRMGRPDTMTGLSFRHLYSEQVVAVARPGTGHSAATSLAELSTCLAIYPPQNSAIRPLVARAMISAGQLLFERRIETTSAPVARGLLDRHNDAVWFISRGVVASELNSGALVALDIPLAQTSGAVGIMSRAEDILSSAAQAFSRLLADRVGAS